MRAAQIIALLLPESRDSGSNDTESKDSRLGELDMQTATALMRDSEGRMSLHPFTRDMPFAEQMMTTGCFRRGKPIIDPTTREVMGYEMEMISDSELRMSNARFALSC